MDIYIQSAGTSPDFDYSWQPQVPPLLSRVSGLIQSESPSLVLAKFEDQFFLLITGLDSPTKKDFAGRVIRHSIAWVADANDENERLTRAIASQYLQGELSIGDIDRLIELGGRNGFYFDSSKFENLSNSTLHSLTLEDSDNLLADTIKIGKNSQDLRNSLALELQNYLLPYDYELLVVVTGIKSEDSLTQARIWRSLSNLVKSDSWKTVSNKKEDLLPKKLIVAIALILLIVAIAIILWILLVH
ncbi:MAG: hypothetical protein LH649_16095 [Pseudanabaena sp. CAN_BIN31]|nr:hypothetical protein [Pseudanabaena sp. CAN_BIN31]